MMLIFSTSRVETDWDVSRLDDMSRVEISLAQNTILDSEPELTV
jgi:hypothetical protein